MLDDPGDLGWSVRIWGTLTDVFLIVGLPTFIVAVAALAYIASRDLSQRKKLLTSAAASVLFMMGVISFLRWDPLHIVDWFMD